MQRTDDIMCNESWWDRAVRVAVGVALLSLIFRDPPLMWGWLGLAPLLTGLAGVCPLYTVFGFSTTRP